MLNAHHATAVSVVAPAHNEEENITPFVEKVARAFEASALAGELIVIDDGSTDSTPRIIRELRRQYPFLVLLSNPLRRGITASIRKGFERAKGEVIIFLPADLQSDPEEDIPKLLAVINEGYDVAVGWRYNRKEEPVKVLSSKIFNGATRILFGVAFRDLGWIKAFRREILSDMEPLRSNWHRFFAILAAAQGYRVKEIPTKVYPRIHGLSKFGKTGFGRAFGALLDIIAIKFMVSFSRRPMAIFGASGIIFFILGLAGGGYLLFLKVTLGNIASHAPLLFLVALLLPMGVQFFAFGFLAEMLASIKDHQKK